MEKEINIQGFLEKFNAEYEFLCNSKGTVCGEDEAAEAFLEFSKHHRGFIREFEEFRGSLIFTAREAAAFMFALDNVGGLD